MSGYLVAGVIVGAWVVALLVFFLQVRDAVEGWQDQDGFHEGREPDWGWPVRIDDERND